MFIALILFLVILAIVIVPYWLFVLQPEEHEERALRQRLRTGRVGTKIPGFVKATEKLSTLAPLDAALQRSELLVEPVRRMLAQAGMSTTVGTIVLASIFAALGAFAIAMILQPSILVGAALAIVASSVPLLYVRREAQKRLNVFEEQFPEAVDLMARALRAGHAMTTALQMAGDEIPNPVGREFQMIFEQQNYGMPMPDALKAFATRIPLLDARIFVTALLTQRETGGNLSEVLDNIASVIRERFKVKRQVRVLSAHGRITGWVLAMMPPILAVILFMISPQHITLLRDDPLGVQLVITGIVLQIIGVLIIRRIVDVEY